jgi:hypothetical protein
VRDGAYHSAAYQDVYPSEVPMRIRLVLAAVVAVAGSVALTSSPASACPGAPCDRVNDVCALVKHPHCVM